MQPMESNGGWVNEDLRDHEGIPILLSLSEQIAGDVSEDLQTFLSKIEEARPAVTRGAGEELLAREPLINWIRSHPEVEDLVQRLQEADEERRFRTASELFPAPGSESSERM